MPGPVDITRLHRELGARLARTPGPAPVADIARRTAAVWDSVVTGYEDRPRLRERAAVAVVRDIYRLGIDSGRRAGTRTVAGHIAAAGTWMAGRIHPWTDPEHLVRGLLTQLAHTAHRQAILARHDPPASATDLPLPRTYAAAFADTRNHDDLTWAVGAATVGWTHGYRNGWAESHRTANRIIDTVRHSEVVATTAVEGTPTLTWLDDLAASAQRIAATPGNHPTRLARLAGPTTPTLPADTPPTPPHHPDPRNKGHRRPRGR